MCICAGGSTAWISSELLFRLHGKLGGDLQTDAAERHEDHKSTEYIDDTHKHFILQFWLHPLKGCWLIDWLIDWFIHQSHLKSARLSKCTYCKTNRFSEYSFSISHNLLLIPDFPRQVMCTASFSVSRRQLQKPPVRCWGAFFIKPWPCSEPRLFLISL